MLQEQATSTLSKQVRRGNSVANLRVYQKGRKATTAEPARRRPDAVVEAVIFFVEISKFFSIFFFLF